MNGQIEHLTTLAAALEPNETLTLTVSRNRDRDYEVDIRIQSGWRTLGGATTISWLTVGRLPAKDRAELLGAVISRRCHTALQKGV